MSKYAYTTVYEEFTGLKPPEPKAAKPRRRRGYGHPYRMRLNMQDDAQQTTADETYEVANTAPAQPSYETPAYDKPAYEKPAYENRERQPRFLFTGTMRRTETLTYENASPNKHHAPKVTYKKRRHYTMTPSSPMMAD